MTRLRILLSAAFLVLGFAAPAGATTYYTRTTGSDAVSCATAQNTSTPKRSINGGVSCLSAGDTLIVGDGTYTDVVLWYYWGHSRSGTAGNPITIKSENLHGAIIMPGAPGMGQGLGGGRNIFAFENQNYWTVDGFITDGTGMSGVIHFNSVGTVGLVIKNNEIRYGADNGTASDTLGVSTSVGDDALTIQNNDIHHMGTGAGGGQSFYAYGMYFTATNSLIEGNEISYASGHGMHMHNTQGSTNGNVMRNNKVHHNGLPSGYPGVLWAAGGYDNLLYNNVIYGNGGSGVRLGGAGAFGARNTVTFNTIVDNGTEAIIVGAGYGNNENHIQNNILVHNGTNSVVLNNSTGNTIGNNFTSASVATTYFVDPSGLDFRLLDTPGAINAGTSGTGITVDYAGATRGSPPDAGAYEFGGVVMPPEQIVVYASPSGDDSRSCTTATNIATPKRTLLSILACPHAAGSTFYLRAGTYVEQFDTSVPGQSIVGGLSWSAPTKLAAYSNEAVVIQHPVEGDEFIIAFNNPTNDHYIVMDGLTLDGNSIAAKTGLGIWNGAHHIRFQNGVIKDTGYANVAVNADNVQLLRSVFQNALAAPIIMVGGTNGTVIRGNTIVTGDREGIGPNGVDTNTNFEISGNTIHGTGTALDRAAIVLYVNTTPLVFNNLIHSNNAGINVQAANTDAKLYNNTIYGNTNNGIQIDTSALNTVLINNIVFGNGGAISNSGTGTSQTTNLITDPPFTNAAGGDFTLDASASGAINVGTTLSPTVIIDIAGVARPQGAGYEIGAYEFIPAVATPIPNPSVSAPLWITRGFFR